MFLAKGRKKVKLDFDHYQRMAKQNQERKKEQESFQKQIEEDQNKQYQGQFKLMKLINLDVQIFSVSDRININLDHIKLYLNEQEMTKNKQQDELDQQQSLTQSQQELYSIKFIFDNKILVKNIMVKGIIIFDSSVVCFYSDDCIIYYSINNESMQQIIKCSNIITQMVVTKHLQNKYLIVSCLDGFIYFFQRHGNMQFQQIIKINSIQKINIGQRLKFSFKSPKIHSVGVKSICLGYDEKQIISIGEDKSMKQWYIYTKVDPYKFRIKQNVNVIQVGVKFIYAAIEARLYIFRYLNRQLVNKAQLNESCQISQIIMISDQQILILFSNGIAHCYHQAEDVLTKQFIIVSQSQDLAAIYISSKMMLVFYCQDKIKHYLSFLIWNEQQSTIYNAKNCEIKKISSMTCERIINQDFLVIGTSSGQFLKFSIT